MIFKKSGFFVLLFLTLYLISWSTFSDKSLKKVWAWHISGYEIYNVAFSKTNDEIAFVKKLHVPDGAEAELFTEEQLNEYRLMAEKNNRILDPELTLMNIEKPQPVRIDWGWEPCFTPDSEKLAYSHQKAPMSLYRDSAVARRGNEILEYDRIKKTVRTLATPGAEGYLSEPFYSADGRKLLFYLSRGVNGEYGPGNVGVGVIDLKTMKTEIKLQPQRELDNWCLIKNKLFLDDEIMVIRARPVSPGKFLAGWYVWELFHLNNEPVVVHEWGKYTTFADPNVGVMRDHAGNILIYDRGWRLLNKQEDSQGPNKSFGLAFGIINSPDGRYFIKKPVRQRMLYSHEGTVSVGDYMDPSFLLSWKFDGVLQEMKWLSDSKRIVLVITAYKDKDQILFANDEIIILEIVRD